MPMEEGIVTTVDGEDTATLCPSIAFADTARTGLTESVSGPSATVVAAFRDARVVMALQCVVVRS